MACWGQSQLARPEVLGYDVWCGEMYEVWCEVCCGAVDTWSWSVKRSNGSSAGIPFARYQSRHSPSPVPNAQADVQGTATGATSLVHSGYKSVEWDRVIVASMAAVWPAVAGRGQGRSGC